MRRREFIALLGSVVALPIASSAQNRPARIGFLGTGAPDTSAIFVDALKDGLRENGLQEGRDYILDFGWAEGNYERFPTLAAQMVQSKVSVILATTISAVQAAQHVTTTTPIVMTSINDPVWTGLVKSLARPGGNTTGLASLAEDVSAKGPSDNSFPCRRGAS
jgi:putative ABC transport system substrate-binding protein